MSGDLTPVEFSAPYLVSPGFDILKCIVSQNVKDDTVVPRKLAAIDRIPASSASKTRTFVLSQQGSFVAINGQRFSPDRIDENIHAGATEIWDIYNAGMGGMMGAEMNFGGGHGMSGPGGFMGHPCHIHSVQFQLLERDGQQPPPGERGWKDTVLLNPGEEVKVIARFMHAGKFVYHCHILEHDDLGMMGSFVVE
ncbi:MAG: multicopper oxidase domain-containing protein [Chlorobiaceae bacterium]|nr:multicopper oxidase domain-containing protein [Chlorobiaceae bacterium]